MFLCLRLAAATSRKLQPDVRPPASTGASYILSQAVADEHVLHASNAQYAGANVQEASNSPSQPKHLGAREHSIAPSGVR